jgi:hypothetical protein
MRQVVKDVKGTVQVGCYELCVSSCDLNRSQASQKGGSSLTILKSELASGHLSYTSPDSHEGNGICHRLFQRNTTDGGALQKPVEIEFLRRWRYVRSMRVDEHL